MYCCSLCATACTRRSVQFIQGSPAPAQKVSGRRYWETPENQGTRRASAGRAHYSAAGKAQFYNLLLIWPCHSAVFLLYSCTSALAHPPPPGAAQSPSPGPPVCSAALIPNACVSHPPQRTKMRRASPEKLASQGRGAPQPSMAILQLHIHQGASGNTPAPPGST